MKLNISDNFTLEDIRKIREYNDKMTEGMSIEELNEYYNKGAEKLRKRLNKTENIPSQVKIDSEIVEYYKSTIGSSYIEEINKDLKKIIELRKSLKDSEGV